MESVDHLHTTGKLENTAIMLQK